MPTVGLALMSEWLLSNVVFLDNQVGKIALMVISILPVLAAAAYFMQDEEP